MTATTGSTPVRFVWLAGHPQPRRCPVTTTAARVCLAPLELRVVDGYAYYCCPEREGHS